MLTLAFAIWIAWHSGVPDRLNSQVAIGITLTLGSIAYAITVIYARALALSLIAPPNRAAQRAAPAPASPQAPPDTAPKQAD